MSDKIRASATMLTYNNAATVAQALESVAEFEDILVLDGGSTDGTLEIARSFGARIEKQSAAPGKISDFTQVRKRSFELAKFDRVIYLDSDELADPELKAEFRRLASAGEFSAFRVSRVPVIEGRVIKYSPFLPDWSIRSVDRRTAHWAEKKRVHEHFKLDPGVKLVDLRGSLLIPWESAEKYRARDRYYLSLAFTKDQTGRSTLRRLAQTLAKNIFLAVKSLLVWMYYAIRYGRTGAVMPWRHEWRFIRYYLLIMQERFKQYVKGSGYKPPTA